MPGDCTRCRLRVESSTNGKPLGRGRLGCARRARGPAGRHRPRPAGHGHPHRPRSPRGRPPARGGDPHRPRRSGFDRLMERWGMGASLRGAGVLRSPSEVLGLVFFWATFVRLREPRHRCARVRRGAPPRSWSRFVPPLFAAVLILVVGWLVANFLSQGLLIAAVNRGRAGSATARARRALGRPALRGGDRAHASRHRQGDGAGRLRDHVRRARLRARAGLRAGRPQRSPASSSSAASAATALRHRSGSRTSRPGGGLRPPSGGRRAPSAHSSLPPPRGLRGQSPRSEPALTAGRRKT